MSIAAPAGLLRFALMSGLFIGVLAHARTASAGPICSGGGVDFVSFEGEQIGDTICRTFLATGSDSDRAKFYLFDESTGFSHLLRITVDEVLQDFGLRVHLNRLPSDYEFPGFESFNCIPYADPALGGPCIEYDVIDPPTEGVEFSGDVTWLIAWELAVGISPMPEIIHERGTDPDDIYDELLAGIFFSPTLGPGDFACDQPDAQTCFSSDLLFAKVDGDPVRAALSDNFSSVAAVQPAPEPATLALLALGLSAYLANPRRRARARRDN